MEREESCFSIRPMRPEDVEAISAIERACFASPWPENAFREELQNVCARYFVAWLGEERIGYGGMWLVILEAQVTNIAILPAFRGRGYGGKLLRTLMCAAYDELGIVQMTLEVRRGNLPAQGLYEKLGFVKEGIRPGYYADTKEDAFIMWNHDTRPYFLPQEALRQEISPEESN